MMIPLTAIMSFVLGVLVATGAFCWLFRQITFGASAKSFVGGIIRGLAQQGYRCVAVRAIDRSVAHVDTLDLALAVESMVSDLGPPPPPTDGDLAKEGV